MNIVKYTGFVILLLVAGLNTSSCQNSDTKETMGKIKEGDMAPDFELPDQDGNTFKLSSLRGKKNIVLYFYPADDTPGCTAEACSFRDSYEEFASNDTEVIGVSGNGTGSHQAFIAKYNLNFTLLSDKGGKVKKLYGVTDFLGLISGRKTFVIDKEGKVVMEFTSNTDATRHVKESLKALEELN